MSDATEISIGDVTAAGTPAGNKVVDSDEMSLALDYSKLMKARGISDEDTEKFLKGVAGVEPEKPQEIPVGQVTAAQAPPTPPSSPVAPKTSSTFLGQANQALANLGIDPKMVGQKFVDYGKDISNIGGEIASYVKNYGPEHETVEPGLVTPEEQKAARLMGIPMVPGNPDGGFAGKLNAAGELELHHPPIYKMTPKERQDLDDRTLKSWGLDPAEERQRGAAFAEARFADNADPIANITSNNAIGNWLQDQLNPKMAASKQYAAIQQTVAAQKILKTPLMHSQEEVDAAISLLDYYKNTTGKSVAENTKDLLEEIKANPGTKLAQIAASLEADPELLMLGKARIGTLLSDAKVASLTADLQRAQKAAEVASRINELDLPESIGTLPGDEERIANIKTSIEAAKKKGTLLNMASEPVIGGAANVALDREAQTKEKGFITPGSEATPFVQGAALGAVAAGTEALRLVPKKGEIPVDSIKPAEVGTPPSSSAGGESVKPGGPGEPMAPETPINKNNHVPYYGGVDASGKVIHIDENTPDTLPIKNMKGEDVHVPVTKMVAWHERVEFPLMHLTGPMESSAIVDLLKRVQGEGTIPKDVLAKLKKGESLSYPEAHEIATMAENARVRALYGIDPKVYQDALKPYIKQVAKDNKSQPASNIPANLDTKPYEDMGGEESLKGQGNTPAVDKLGDIGKKAVVAGGMAAVGAGAGALLNPDDKEGGAKEGMFLPLLTRVFSHGEDFRPLRRDINGPVDMAHERALDRLGSPKAREAREILNALVDKGYSPTSIWMQHGYYQDAKGNWLREISDEGLTYKDVSKKILVKTPEGVIKYDHIAPGNTIFLNQFIEHPEFAKEYPVLWKGLKITFSAWDSPKGNASFNPGTYTITAHPEVAKDILVHEMQHAVQEYEGLPRGTSPALILERLKDERSTARQHLSMLTEAVHQYRLKGEDIPDPLWEKYQGAAKKVAQYPANEETLSGLAYQRYRETIGEAQASTAEERQSYNDQMRRNTPPGSQIIPKSRQWDIDAPGQVMKNEIPETNKLPGEDEHVKAAAAGNQRSIGVLYNHFMPRLIRVMDKFMRQAGPRLGLGGEDIAQRAFFKAIQSLPEFKGGSSFYTWLYSIGRNEALNAITDAGREVPTESMFKPALGDSGSPGSLTGHVGFGGDTTETGSDPVKPSVQGAMSDEGTPESENAGHQISMLVRQTIATLPKNVADVLRLREIEGLTDVETARALNMNVNTVKVYNMRGKEYLARAFQGTETEKLFKQQGGFVDPELLKRLAKFAVLAGGGAALGANYFDPQHPYKSMVQGAALALMTGQIKWGNVFKSFKDSMHYDPTVSATEQLNQYDWDIARGERLKAQTVYAIDGLVKSEDQRVKIGNFLDGDTSITLTPEEQKAAAIGRSVYNQVGQEALQAGILHNFLENYINHEWKPTPAREKLLTEMKEAFQKQPNMSPKDRHALTRKFTSLAEGKAAGLEPVSEDVNVLIGMYIDSLTRAMANKNLLDSLRHTEVEGGKNTLVMPAGRAPYSYVPVSHSQLARYRVHPSIAPSLEFLYHTHGGGAIVQGVESLNTALKRVQVSLSLFHAKSLLDAFAGAGEFTHPWRNFVDAAQAAAGKGRGHEAYLTGARGDDIDYLIRSLKITPRKGTVPVEDVTSGFYEGLKTLQDSMDSAIKGSGKYTVGVVTHLSKVLDHLLWENLHSGLKLVVGMNSLERLRRSYARDVMRDPNAEVPTTAELADRAASFTNDVFGGLNWRRLADDAKTQWGHEMGQLLANPTGRRIAQVMMFAPDWTYSTVRSVVKAVGKGSGFEGLIRPKQVADLHRLYLIRSAFIYATLYNGINIALSGHPIWENKRNGKPEPFLVDLGNGEWAQANKHAMEVPNMLMHPAKWAMGKLGNIPSEIMEQTLGKEYLNPDYMPPMKGSRIVHAAKRLLPFSGTSLLDQGPKEAISSALGVPIYGHTAEAAKALKKEKKEKAKDTKAAKKQARINALLKGE